MNLRNEQHHTLLDAEEHKGTDQGVSIVKQALRALSALVLFVIVCGVAYTGVVTAIAQVAFPHQSNGSLITIAGTSYGSELLAQDFTQDQYLWGRMMDVDTSTYADSDGNSLMYASPFNLSPTSPEYLALVAARTERILQAKSESVPSSAVLIPADLTSASGSGLDPYISVSAAEFQIDRIAQSRDMTSGSVESIIRACTTTKLLGFVGEDVVNVLMVNLMLDGILEQ